MAGILTLYVEFQGKRAIMPKPEFTGDNPCDRG